MKSAKFLIVNFPR